MQGKYIKFFCADGVMEKNCIEDMVNYLEIHTEKDFVISDTYYIDENGKKHDELRSDNKSEIGFHLDMNEKQMTSIIKDLGNAKTSFFEIVAAQNAYYKIKDYELLKSICHNSQYIDKITKNDTWAFEFIIAEYMLSTVLGDGFAENFASYWTALQVNAYTKIHDVLENNTIRQLLKDRLNFGVKEFRELYTYEDRHTKITLKDKIFHKKPKELNIIDLSFLIFRKLYNLITFRTFKDILKGKKKA